MKVSTRGLIQVDTLMAAILSTTIGALSFGGSKTWLNRVVKKGNTCRSQTIYIYNF